MSWASSAPGVTGWEYRPQYGPVSNAVVYCAVRCSAARLLRSFRCAGPGEHAAHTVIAFLAGVLKQRPWRFRHRNLGRPGTRKGGRVVDMKLVLDRIGVRAREPLH